MNIMKFNEAFDLSGLLAQFKLTSPTGLDDMLDKLKKYKENLSEDGLDLIVDLEREKKTNWSNIRKWKLDSIVKRYEKAISEMDFVDEIEDMLVEIEDVGWKPSILTKSNKITFLTSGHPIKKIADLFTFLNSSRRFGFRLDHIQLLSNRTVKVDVSYKLKTSEWSEEHELSTDDRFKLSAQREEDDE